MLGVPPLLRNQNDQHPDLKIENRPDPTASGALRALFSNHNRPLVPGIPRALQPIPSTLSGPQSSGLRLDSSGTSLTEKWVERYASGLQPSNDVANAIAIDRANHIYVAGISDATYTGGDYTVVKYTKDGETLWTSRFQCAPNSYNEPTAIAVDTAENVFLTGYGYASSRNADCFTVKFDKNGAEQWRSKYGNSAESTDVATSIALDAAGNVYVAGYSYGSSTDFDYLIIKYDRSGAEQWVARYDGPGHGVDVAAKIAIDFSGNIYVTGFSQGLGTGFDYATVSYTNQGIERWNARYNSPANGDDVAAGLAVDGLGNVVVTGSSRGTGSGYDFVTVKYSTGGSSLWEARYNGTANADDIASDVQCDRLGNVYVTGSSRGSGTQEDFATIKYTRDGAVKWVSRFDNLLNGPDVPVALAVTGQGGAVITGYSRYHADWRADYSTVIYDSGGTMLSSSLYNGIASGDDFPAGVVVDRDDNAFVTGTSGGNAFDFATVEYVSDKSAEWPSHYASGAGSDRLVAMTTDPSGNVYVTGSNSRDVRTLKYDSVGALQWVAIFSALRTPVAAGLAVDKSGNVAVTGHGFGPSGSLDIMTVEYNPAGVQKWLALYNGAASGDDRAASIVVDDSENVYITGSSNGATANEYVTIKYDGRGNTVWIGRYSGTTNRYEVPAALAVDKGGNVFVTGTSVRPSGSYDYATIKYGPNGTQQWVAYYDGAGGSDFAAAIALDRDGAVYVTGKSFGINSSSDFATVKYDPSGRQQWVARFAGGGGGVDGARAIAVDSRKNVFVTGFTFNQLTSLDYETIRYDSNGIQQWASCYNGSADGVDLPVGLVLDRQDNVYVTGTSSGGGTRSDFATVSYDARGVQRWVKRYNGSANLDDQAAAIAIDSGGGIYAAGTSVVDSAVSYFVIRYGFNEAPVWPVRYEGPGVSFDVVDDMVADSAGNVYLTGGSYSPESSMDVLTMKYNAAGTVEWSARYGGLRATYEEGVAIAIDGTGAAYVTGLTFNSGGITDYLTIKYTPGGREEWVRQFNRLGNGYNFAAAIAVDRDRNVYVTGYSFNGSSYDYTTLKYGPDGTLLWTPGGYVTYDGPAGGDDIAVAMVVDSSSDVYVTGYSRGTGTSYDYATIKYSSGGVREWVARYNGPTGGDDRPAAIALDSAGNVYVTGTSQDTFYNQCATVAYTPGGDQKWAARYSSGKRNSDEAVAIAVDGGRNVYVAGNGFDSAFAHSDFITVKYDSTGMQQWVSRYDGASHSEDLVAALELDQSGNVYVTGKSMGPDLLYDYATVMYNSRGLSQWVGRYKSPANSSVEAKTVRLDHQGNVYVTGNGSGYRWKVINTIKYAPTVSEVGGVPQGAPASFQVFQNYPNPFNPQTTIRYVLGKRSHVRVSVYDLLGREIGVLVDAAQESGLHTVLFNSGGLSSGAYFFEVRSTGGYVSVKKMMILR